METTDILDLYAEDTELQVLNSRFVNISAKAGGAIYAVGTELCVINTHFVNNSAVSVGAALFHANRIYNGEGGALYTEHIRINVLDSQFINNSASSGGAILSSLRICFLSLYNAIFATDSASNQGGSIYLNQQSSGCTNNEFHYQIRYSQFTNNSAKLEGGAIYCKAYEGINIDYTVANSNSAVNGDGGFAYLSKCKLNVQHSFISSNRADNGGGIYAMAKSEIELSSVNFTKNLGRRDGGALYLRDSKLKFFPVYCRLGHNGVTIDSNVAAENGGGIFVLDQYCDKQSFSSMRCFFDADSAEKNIFFLNNSAKQGPVLYGGLLDRCHGLISLWQALGILGMKYISSYKPIPLAISSGPVRVCFCDKDQINCDERYTLLQAMRGQAVSLFVVSVDQDSNPLQSAIIAEYVKSDAELAKGEVRQGTSTECKVTQYHIFTQNQTSITLNLQPDDFRDPSYFSSITINITVLPCSRGLEQDGDRCVCERRLRRYFHKEDCNVGDDTIQTRQSLWLQYDTQHLKIHTNCPLDYCQQLSDTISLSYPDQQCSNNHNGVICGSCQDNHSIALGSSKCLKCASSYAFAWLIPVFAVAGLALVALL